MDEQRLAEIEKRLRDGCSGHEYGTEYVSCQCFEDDAEALLAEVRRLHRDRDWVKAAVTTNRDVCEPCAAEIARAVGWTD